MEHKHAFLPLLAGGFVLGFTLLAGAYFIPWKTINWGKLQNISQPSITVTGQAKSKQKNQIATFNAGVSAVHDNKQSAIYEVNTKIAAIIQAAKDFGIKSEDIKTQNMNVFQSEETYYEEGRQKARPGQWRVNNTIEVILRDVDRAGNLASTLTKAGATSMYGPNFQLDDTIEAENQLLAEAVEDARKKAEIIAKGSERKLGKVLNVLEGSASYPQPIMYAREAGGGGGAVEPGTGTVYQSVTVTFEME